MQLALPWVFPLLLIVPNVALACTEHVPALYKLVNIALPLGVYYLIMGSTRRTALLVLLLFPISFFAAFQIVLLFLYGGSVLAVDMLLNVVTTNPAEVSELLGNMFWAMFWVVVLYIPPVVWAIWRLFQKDKKLSDLRLSPLLATGGTLTGIGVVFLIATYIFYPQYQISRELFPVNVGFNVAEAWQREGMSRRWPETSRDFSYQAVSERPADEREIYVMVIGETARADNWQLLGYDRPTTPRLAQREGLVGYPFTLSESNTTHKSVPMLMSWLDSRTFGDSIAYTKGIISAFNDAGYETGFYSTQHPNNSYIDYFGKEASTAHFLIFEDSLKTDADMLSHLRSFIANAKAPKLFVVMHTYGSHFNYLDRVPAEFAYFPDHKYLSASPSARTQLINAYDNTIYYTDYLLDGLIQELEDTGLPAALIYASDHGEDIYDDQRGRFLHASPTPTYYQLHVPMVVWMSSAYRAEHPDAYKQALAHQPMDASSTQALFHTTLDLAGISSPYFRPNESLINPAYAEPERLYTTDHNEGVPVSQSGWDTPDDEMLEELELKHFNLRYGPNPHLQ